MSYRFFQNKKCEYFPCHKVKNEEDFNCLLCFCPLYTMENCGGNYSLINGSIKDCSKCVLPHYNYDYIMGKLGEKKLVDVYFAKAHEGAVIPSKLTEDAGYDIYACFDDDYIIIEPHHTVMIPTGIKSAISEDYYFQIFERGSTGTKGMGQRCGVIDSGYRGEWFIPITNHNSDKSIVILKKEADRTGFESSIVYPYEKAICQCVILPVPKTKVHEISEEELMSFSSLRGEGALGSSKK